MRTYIGIDLGGTYIKYGLVSEAGEIIEKGKVATPAGCGYAETVEAIASAVRELAAKHGAWVCGLGIGAPGVVDGERGIVRTSGNLGWENKPLAGDLSAKLGIPAVLTNDANAAAYGEYVCGAGSEYKSVVLITLGTGVGSGIVLGGKLFEGCVGAARNWDMRSSAWAERNAPAAGGAVSKHMPRQRLSYGRRNGQWKRTGKACCGSCAAT